MKRLFIIISIILSLTVIAFADFNQFQETPLPGAGGGSADLSKPGAIGTNTPAAIKGTTITATTAFVTTSADGTHVIQAYNSSSLPTCNTSTTPPTGTFGAIAQ